MIKGKLECDICKREIVFTGYVCDDCQHELRKQSKKHINLQEDIRSRVDGYAYPILILLFAGTSYLVVEDHGWAISIFIFLLETTVLELGYRLSIR
jgi:hypothetical protein